MYRIKIDKEKKEIILTQNKKKGLVLLVIQRKYYGDCENCFLRGRKDLCLDSENLVKGIRNDVRLSCFCNRLKMGTIKLVKKC